MKPLTLGLLLLALTPASAAPAEEITVDAADRGWYSRESGHDQANENTLTGSCCGSENLNSWFLFDLADVEDAVGAGMLRLEVESYNSSAPEEPFSIFDVTTDPANLVQSHSPGPETNDVYFDLQSGAVYGRDVVSSGSRGRILEIPLSAAAISDVNRARGGRFAVGVRLDVLRGVGLQYVRFSGSTEQRVHQLVLEKGSVYRVSLFPQRGLGPVGGFHSVTASIRDIDGSPAVDAQVDVTVESGPNAGVAGVVRTNSHGNGSFTYAGDGGPGIDVITARHVDGDGGSFASASGARSWDTDCNGNSIPDTCDLRCDAFGGACQSAYPVCGEGADLDHDGIPDGCNRMPDCRSATPTTPVLWPPDQRIRRIGIVGVSDPDGDPVSVSVTSIRQDEPVDETRPGQTCPDAFGIGGTEALLSAERSGAGDGRVYQVEIRAEDSSGGACNASLSVCVPLTGPAQGCGDGGLRFDSVECSPLDPPTTR